MYKLRDYQQECVDACLDYIRSKRKDPVLAVLPVGTGKSLVISELARLSEKPVLVLQPRIELLNQNYEKLINLGGEATIYSAGAGSKIISKCTYATLGSVKKLAKEFNVDLLIIDEADSGYPPESGSMFMKFIAVLKPKKCIGFTATPFRMKPVGFDMQINMLNKMRPRYFKDIIYVLQVKDVIERGYWAKCCYQEFAFDDSKLQFNSSFTDFTDESIKHAIKEQGVDEAIIERTKRALANGATSILIFASSLESADFIKEGLGNGAEIISSNTPTKQRKQLIDDYKSKKIKVMINYGILGVGFDYPDLQVIIMGRPTNSLSLYYQILGRGVRNNTGKKQFVFIDFGGNVRRLGRIETLEIIDYPNWGWGCFINDVIKTNTPLGQFPITKEDIDKDQRYSSGSTMTFGKYKGKDLAEIPLNYFQWLLSQQNFIWKGSNMKALKSNIEELLFISNSH